jgi:uncharacterized protein (DUF58 family)
MNEAAPTLLDESVLRKLGRLRLASRRARAGQMKGERRSTRKGTSIEFADYRDYVPGDDLRRVDWNVYARTDRPYVKLHEEEEDLAVHVLLDASRSMDWPAPGEPGHKIDYARRLAGLLGHLALTAGDRLTVTALRSDGLRQYGPARGRAHVLPLFAWLAAQDAGGVTDLSASLRYYALNAARPGLAIVISDMFSPSGYQDGLNALGARGYEIAIVHTLAADELDPPFAGDLRLIDAETQTPQDVTLDPSLRSLYVRRLAAWQEEIGAFCRARELNYIGVVTGEPPEEVILRDMRHVGLVH